MKKQQEEKMGGGADSGLNRKKKTPEEIAAEQAEANQDDFTSKPSILFIIKPISVFTLCQSIHSIHI